MARNETTPDNEKPSTPNVITSRPQPHRMRHAPTPTPVPQRQVAKD